MAHLPFATPPAAIILLPGLMLYIRIQPVIVMSQWGPTLCLIILPGAIWLPLAIAPCIIMALVPETRINLSTIQQLAVKPFFPTTQVLLTQRLGTIPFKPTLRGVTTPRLDFKPFFSM